MSSRFWAPLAPAVNPPARASLISPASLQIHPVRRRRELADFVAFPYELHRHDRLWTAPLRRDVRVMLSRAKNLFFEHAEAEYLLARRGGSVAGRIAAIHNRLHNEFHAERAGFFGFFECVDDVAVARTLFRAALGSTVDEVDARFRAELKEKLARPVAGIQPVDRDPGARPLNRVAFEVPASPRRARSIGARDASTTRCGTSNAPRRSGLNRRARRARTS